MYIERTIEQSIREVSDFFPVVLLSGPRQVGKTTVLRQVEKGSRAYVSLDSADVREQAQTDPRLFLERHPAPLLIDEIQNAPGLLPYIKERVDADRTPGQYWLTGSQQFALMQGVSESLAGRVGVLHLQGLSQAEKEGRPHLPPFLPTRECIAERETAHRSVSELFQRIWMGSYPALHGASARQRQYFYSSYLETYIERDVRQIVNISNSLTFLNFMRSLAAQSGSLLSYSSVSRDLGIAVSTVKAWLSVLVTSDIVCLLPPYSNNLSSRVVKTPKIYFTDTGLACHLTRWDSPEALEVGAYNGAIFETYVVSEIIKSYRHHGIDPSLYFYRDKQQREIDLLLDHNGLLYPMEIKKKSEPNKNDIRHFNVIEKVLGRTAGPGAVLCAAPTHSYLTEDVSVVPVSYL